MSDAIDPRLSELGMAEAAAEKFWNDWQDGRWTEDGDPQAEYRKLRDHADQLTAELSRQLLPPDHVAVSREDASEYLQTLECEQMEMNPFAWVGSKQELQDRIDRLRAALSANGSDVATSPEEAEECQTVITMTMEPGTLTEAKATELAEAFTNYINAIGERDVTQFTLGPMQYVDDGIDEVRFVIGTGKVAG
jgi:hypothetical protein